MFFSLHKSINSSVKPLIPSTCVRNIALVFGVIADFSFSISNEKFFKLISTNTGLNPLNITDDISEIHVSGGTII
jgi:hypothetical protein